MHIAWLGKQSPFCGNVTYSREITHALLERGHQVSFFHFASPREIRNFPKGCLRDDGGEWKTRYRDVLLPSLYKSQLYTIPQLRAVQILIRKLQALQPDLVHASLTLSPLDFVLPDICAGLGLPLIATFHPAFDRRYCTFTSRMQQLAYQIYAPSLAHYDLIIVFSEAQRAILIQMGLNPERVISIPNGVDAERFSPGPSPIKAELQADRLFVYQGRVAAEKNLEALLKAWKSSRLRENCKLVIVGDGPLRRTLQRRYHAHDGILWLGYVADQHRRIEILRGADVFILPSLIEGLSLSLLEAMACGLAVVATDVGADGEVLEAGAGIQLDPRSVQSELETLLPLLQDQVEFTRILGQKARTRVLERYTLSQNITEVEQAYADLLGQPAKHLPWQRSWAL